jgi:hypothetical protein
MFFAFQVSMGISRSHCLPNHTLGSAVAVQRIFSGARNVIGIRRARLQAETICKLMLVKAQIRTVRIFTVNTATRPYS